MPPRKIIRQSFCIGRDFVSDIVVHERIKKRRLVMKITVGNAIKRFCIFKRIDKRYKCIDVISAFPLYAR